MQKETFAKAIGWFRSAAGITILLAILLAVGAWALRGPYIIVNTIVTGGMLALVAMGLALMLGVMNVPLFALGEWFMVGSLTAYYIYTPLSAALGASASASLVFLMPFVGILGAMVAGALVGILTEKLVFHPLRKRSRENWVMNSFLLTVGLSVLMINLHQLIFGTEFKGISRYWEGAPYNIMDVFIARDRIYAFAIAAVVIAVFGVFMKATRIGRAIRAVSQDTTGAQMVGIDLDGIQMLTVALSTTLAAIAGASLLFLYPSYPTVGLEPLYMGWFIVILAGLGNVLGAVVGAFIVALFKVVTVEFVGAGWDFVVPTALIILVLIFKPSGIFGSEVRGVLDQ